MNSTLRDAQAPSHRECLLPSVARTPSVTQITPAKKITFLKRGDPQFAGVRLAVDQRAFKSFGALMDELSQRMPLSFGVRSVTTPRGLHGLSALEQLKDGGCYLCSDKKTPKTPSGPGWTQGRNLSAQQSRDFESRSEAPGTSSSCKGPKAPRRIMLIKNGDPRLQQTVVLSHRNTRNLTAFLSKASDLLHFPVKQVYTTNGEKVDSWKGLLHSPSVLVCAGYESFKPLAMEDARRYGIETLSGQTTRSKTGSWGPKAKQSVIHSRPRSGSRPRRFSLLSEKSGLSDPPVSLHHTQMGPAPDRHPQDTPAQLGPLVASDDVEKKVCMNQDGSLSIEMKVRFHLLGEDALLWSRRVRRASVLTAASGEVPVLGEVDSLHCVCESHLGGSSEPGAQRLGPCEAGCEKALGRGQWQPGSSYEIWMNPLYSAQEEEMASQRRSRLTQHSHSRKLWNQRVTGRKRSSKDSVSPDSSDRPPKDSEPNSSCGSRSPEGSVGSCDLHVASGAVSQREAGREAGGMSRTSKGPGAQGTGQDREPHSCLKPQSQDMAGAPCGSSGSAGSHEESSEREKQHQGCLSKTRVMTASWSKATQREGPSPPAVSPLSLRNKDSQAEESRQGSRYPEAKGMSGVRSPLVSDHSGSGDTAESCSLPSACASVPGRRRKQKDRAKAVSSPSISSHSQGAWIGHLRQRPNLRDIHCQLDSAVPRQVPGPPSRGRACPDSPASHLSGSSPGARNQAFQDAGPPSSASLHSQDAQGVSSALMTPVSNSDCASNFNPPYSPSTEIEGHSEFRACSPAFSPSNTSDLLSSPADGLDKKGGGDLLKPSWTLVLPVGESEGGMPEAHRSCCCSPISTSLFDGTPGEKTQSLQTYQTSGSQGPFSEVSLVCDRYCPTPPRTWPFVKKHPSGSSSPGTGWGPDRGKLREEKLDVWHPRPPGSQSGAMREAVRAWRRGSSSCGPRTGRMLQGKAVGGGESLEEQEDGRMALGALPRASPDTVVREWLSNIPEEPIPMKCETVDESIVVVGEDPEGPKEDPADKHSLKGLGEPVPTRQLSHEGAASEKAESDRAFPVTGDAHPTSGEGLPCSGVSETPKEAESNKGMAVDYGVGQRVLPHKVSASIQIMKVLMGSKQGRPSSLPEVSSTVGRRLSHSARALITCLAELHFFDEDFGSPTDKVRFRDSSQYQELLSTFQSLWPGCGLRQSELDSGLWDLGWCQALPGLGSHVMPEDFTPTSSSGVDVGSGSGGSGEGSGPCAMDSTLVPEGIELPLKIPSQRPDSRTSKNQDDPENQQPIGSTTSSDSQERVCATRKDKAERNSGEQVLGSNLDQVVENTIQKEEVQLEKIEEEKEIAELQGEGVQGSPGEGRVMGQEFSEADSDNGEGTQENNSVQEEEAGGDPASSTLCHPGTREKPPEPPESLSRRDSDASESQSSPSNEPGLEKLLKTAEIGHEQTQARYSQGSGEKSSSTACRVSPDPDPLWVSKLLKRMEKAFMAHLTSATGELRARWSLQSNYLLDQMVAELQQDVGQRLQASTEKEVLKIQSRAGGRTLGLERETLRWEMSLQTEQRRRRLQGLRNLSAFSEQAQSQGPLSFPVEDVPTLHGALGTWLVGEAEGEEFCPCEACMRKKMIPTSPKDTMGAPSAPIKKAFDLQHILQKKKGGCANGEGAEAVPEKRGMELLQGDTSGTGTIQGSNGGLELGLGQDPGTEEGGEDESSQTLDGDGDPQVREDDEVAQNGEGITYPGQSSVPEGAGREEEGSGEKEENSEMGSGAEGSLEGEASGGGDQSPEGQNDSAVTTEGERNPESGGGGGGEKESSSQVVWDQGQQGETSGNSRPDQEGKPALLSTPSRDAPCQRSDSKAGLASSSTFSLGNCSQLSQKGSEEKPSNRDMRSIEDESKGVPSPERKGTSPESSTSEQEGVPFVPSTPEQEIGLASGLEAENVVESPSSTEMRFKKKNFTMDRTDGFG